VRWLDNNEGQEVWSFTKETCRCFTVPVLLVHTMQTWVELCTLYKRQIKSRRWYLYIFYHSLTMMMANAWFLYRREAKSLRNNKSLQMKEFQIQAATSLMCQGKVPRGRPSLQTPPPVKKHCVQPGPQLDVRFDNVGHMPMSLEKKGRCRNCPTGYSFWTCSKCKVYLCLVCGKNPKNCFSSYNRK
jgi:hypothetical protein